MNKKVTLLILGVAASIFLTACASSPKKQESSAAPQSSASSEVSSEASQSGESQKVSEKAKGTSWNFSKLDAGDVGKNLNIDLSSYEDALKSAKVIFRESENKCDVVFGSMKREATYTMKGDEMHLKSDELECTAKMTDENMILNFNGFEIVLAKTNA